jgi:hypothetical protein
LHHGSVCGLGVNFGVSNRMNTEFRLLTRLHQDSRQKGKI